MSVAAGVSDAAIAVREKLRGRIGQTRVKRYWPGKAPEWADDQDEGRGGLFGRDEEDEGVRAHLVRGSAEEDARLRRLVDSRRDREEAVARHREIRAAEIVSTREEEVRQRARALEEEEEEEDEEEIERRRKMIRERLLQRQKEEEEMRQEEEEEEDEEEEEESSEYETDSEEEGGGVTMIKPVFVPKKERETVAEREKQEEEERELEEAVKRRLEERKVETKQIVVEEIRKEEERERKSALGEDEADKHDVDTDDELNEAEEFEGWRQREIARIRRERDEREALAREKEERERLSKMTEEERREWERKNPKVSNAASKKKWKFMQKYYHKGAFFQDAPDDRGGTAGGDDIFRRDFSAPTGEDKLDKSILPKVMQVKHFGRSGRSKWTHLVNEDTTSWDNPWTFNDPLRAKYNNKMAGMNQPLAKPKGKKLQPDDATQN